MVEWGARIRGLLGISRDVPPGQLPQETWPSRIYDGPSEEHRRAITKRVTRRTGA